MALIVCEEKPGLADFVRFVYVTDINGRRESLQIDANFLTRDNGQSYLPVDVVHRAADKVLIELPDETHSGTRRLWVNPSDLHEPARR